jgi:hypothetical protein
MLLRDGFLERKLTCAVCGVGLDHKRVGRIRRFCSDKCRDGARRDRSFVGAARVVAQTHETTENTPTNSMASKGKNRGRAFPVDLLGHGYRWPGSGIDPELRRNILAVELGGALTRRVR